MDPHHKLRARFSCCLQLGEVAVFHLASWEPGVQQVVVRFGSTLQHVVHVPLRRQDSTSSGGVLGWHYVSMGEATGAADMPHVNVPGVRGQRGWDKEQEAHTMRIFLKRRDGALV